jgi:uncharacterized Zn-binding protein involved in type VI secretion
MGMPFSRVGDLHVCPMLTPGVPPIPHVGGPIMPPGHITLLIGSMPAAKATAMCVCVGPPAPVPMGSPTVLIGGMPAGRLTDMTGHGGAIVFGLPTVLVG